MPRRRTARSFPLEWKTDVIAITDTTAASATRGEFDLDLLPDEIAEIHCISSNIACTSPGEADNDCALGMYISMDPDADDDPLVFANLEDLEIFFLHFRDFSVNSVDATATFYADHGWNKDVWFHEPILVGTNIAQVANGSSDTDLTATFLTTIYFTRRKASAQELNQILLKRR